MNLTELPVHPAADVFPMLSPVELDELSHDIAENGLHEPIWLWTDSDGTEYLLDGRNRLAACRNAGVEPRTQRYLGEDPITFTVSLNVKRRHLNSGQRAMLGLKLKPLYEEQAKAQISEARRAAAAQRADRKEDLAKAREERSAVPRDRHGIPIVDASPQQKKAFQDEQREADRVYFAVSSDGQRVKIGKTWNINARLEELRRGDPELQIVGSIAGSFEIERALHTRFSEHRHSGEWFRYDAIKSDIQKLLQKCGDRTFVTVAEVSKPVDTLAKTAAAAAVSRRTLAQANRVAEKAPDLVEKVETGEIAIDRADRIIRDREAEQKRVVQAKAEASKMGDVASVDIRHGDFRDVFADLSGVDAIITDPPYPAEFIPLLGDLAAWADKVLTEDGVLAVLIGQTYLPEVYRLLDSGRPYRWTACYLTSGPGYVSHPRKVQSNWKPLIVFGGGKRFADVFRSEGSDADAKNNHKWGQDYGAFHTIVERLTERGQRIADPFMGSGTTILAAHALGRHAIGCDIDADHVAKAQERLS